MTRVEDKSVIFAFQVKPGTCNGPFSASMLDCSSATTALEDQLDFLEELNPQEPDTLLFPGLDSSSLTMGAHGDEFSCLLEQMDKWNSPIDPALSAWSYRCPYQNDIVDVAGSHSIQAGNLIASEDQECMEEEKEVYKVGGLLSPAVPIKTVTSSGKRFSKEGNQSVMLRSSSKPRLSKPSDSSENSEDELSFNTKTVSKNLVSERRRRKKLNERLYSLRALVPKISKMDKASIVSDAISYVEDLQKQVESIEADIQALQSNKGDVKQLPCFSASNNGTPEKRRKSTTVQHRILELEVAQMEELTYHLRIHCKKGPGVLVQLTKALEALDFEIINANLTSVNDHILNNVVVKARTGEMLTPEELKKITLGIISRFGLVI